ncbi:ABC transporter permease subunit [Chengkuizengella axinellae]|uniref:ABC transporter permease subunit n=1 Tax=Chengkuizengella axinellae TaxID=3064388 RepID=A0ABT9J3Y6_9BACL|nr:ABC transporter permease subunit [Chengkuizengella sp. 2205SS18-9]MDP5276305.1 ABC transporter permease subunit [Chengkuizengella sp. 2205SS18-9]
MRFVSKTMFEMILIIIGIILVSTTISLFQMKDFSLLTFGNNFVTITTDIISPQNLVYINPISDVERNLFPIILNAYFSSAQIFFLALIISLFISLSMIVLYFSASHRLKKSIERIGFIISSLPDIFLIVITQIFVVWFFKQTGILVFDFVATMDNHIVLVPAIILSVLPTFFFFSLMISILREEEGMAYVELAKSKGLKKYRILFIHMMRNILISLTTHGKHITWFMLSNLLVLEYLFNVFGVTSFLFSYNTSSIFTVTCILLFVPLFLILKTLQFTFSQKIGSELNL